MEAPGCRRPQLPVLLLWEDEWNEGQCPCSFESYRKTFFTGDTQGESLRKSLCEEGLGSNHSKVAMQQRTLGYGSATPELKNVEIRRSPQKPALHVNGLMTLGFAGARQQTNLCNESLMLEKLPACGKSFEEMMKKVDSKKWCNLTEFIMYYDNFTQCTEREANNASCFWPNPLAEGFITGIHKQFFSNCTSEKVHWEDPPDEILVTLILIPVMLTCAMITLVVWCSKRSDILV